MRYLSKDGLRYYHQKKVKPTIKSYIDTTLDKSSNNAISNKAVTAEFEKYVKTENFTDTKNTAGSTNTSSKIFLIGATTQASNPQTFSHDTAYVGADGCVYSNKKKVSVEGHTHNYAGSSSAGGAATSANKLNTPITIKIGSSGKTFDGSNNVTWTLAEIGAAPSSTLGSAAYLDVIASGSSASHVESSNNHIPDMSILAYWNGAYTNDGKSRLSYCNRGAFGTIVTKNTTDYATSNHTHNYAGSSSAGGAATSANKLNTNAGSSAQPVYFSNGVPAACSYTLGTACQKNYTDSASASTIGTGTSLVTERDVYYGLPTINGIHSYNANTKLYPPTSAGTNGYTLHSNGGGAPSWVNIGEIVTNANTTVDVTGNGVITLLEASYTLTPGTWIIYNRVKTNGIEGRYSCVTISTRTNNTISGGFEHLINKSNAAGGNITLEWIDIVEITASETCYPAITARPDSGSVSYNFELSAKAIRIK